MKDFTIQQVFNTKSFTLFVSKASKNVNLKGFVGNKNIVTIKLSALFDTIKEKLQTTQLKKLTIIKKK